MASGRLPPTRGYAQLPGRASAIGRGVPRLRNAASTHCLTAGGTGAAAAERGPRSALPAGNCSCTRPQGGPASGCSGPPSARLTRGHRPLFASGAGSALPGAIGADAAWMEPAVAMPSCWGAVLGAAVSVPLLMLAAAPYVRCGALGERRGGLRAAGVRVCAASLGNLLGGRRNTKGFFVSAAPAAVSEWRQPTTRAAPVEGPAAAAARGGRAPVTRVRPTGPRGAHWTRRSAPRWQPMGAVAPPVRAERGVAAGPGRPCPGARDVGEDGAALESRRSLAGGTWPEGGAGPRPGWTGRWR